MKDVAVIIGAGPAGLTCALELLRRTRFRPIVLESLDGVGGISRTFKYLGNCIDLGGHRFFSKSDRVMDWWANILPIQGPTDELRVRINYQNQSRWLDIVPGGPDPAVTDEVMLVRRRKSRILFRRELFDYPISLTPDTLIKFGATATIRIGLSYLHSRLFPITPEKTLEEFFINRFGRELYETFFRDYTQKIWGTSCSAISADWGAQRIKNLSLTKTIAHAFRAASPFRRDIPLETSLIDHFLYPKFGPGQMWERVAAKIIDMGGEIHLEQKVVRLDSDEKKIFGVHAIDLEGTRKVYPADHVFSTMPIRELVRGLGSAVPGPIRRISEGLIYRDFITVGLLLRRLRLGGDCRGRELSAKMPDNWIYVQEPDVKVGRLQFFNNWSPFMVENPDTIWMGAEYFCDEGDALWSMSDADLSGFAVQELDRIGVIHSTDVIGTTVLRVPKAYPAYFGTFDQFPDLRSFLDQFDNLQLLGRNGMHRYNNQDHSMLTAMVAVDNILSGGNKGDVWSVNTESDYHEKI